MARLRSFFSRRSFPSRDDFDGCWLRCMVGPRSWDMVIGDGFRTRSACGYSDANVDACLLSWHGRKLGYIQSTLSRLYAMSCAMYYGIGFASAFAYQWALRGDSALTSKDQAEAGHVR